jgi:hypothetical protein
MSTNVPFGLTGACSRRLRCPGFASEPEACFACCSARFDAELSSSRFACPLVVTFPDCGRYGCMRTGVAVCGGGRLRFSAFWREFGCAGDRTSGVRRLRLRLHLVSTFQALLLSSACPVEVGGVRWGSQSPHVPFHAVCLGFFSLAFRRGEGARQTSGIHVCVGFLSAAIHFADSDGVFLLAWAYSGSPSILCVAPASMHFRAAPGWCLLSCSRCVMATMPFCSCYSCMLPASMLRRPRHRRGEQGLCLRSCALVFRVLAYGDASVRHPARHLLHACRINPEPAVQRVSEAVRIDCKTHCHSV